MPADGFYFGHGQFNYALEAVTTQLAVGSLGVGGKRLNGVVLVANIHGEKMR